MSRVFANVNTDHLDVASNLGITAVPLTISIWYKRTGAGSVTQRLVMHGVAGSTDNAWMLEINVASDGVRAVARTTGSNSSEKTGHTVDSVWHHDCAVFSANNNRIAYLDGVAGTADTASRSPASVNAFRIGNSLATAFPTTGKIGYVTLRSVALAGADVAREAGGVHPVNVQPWTLVQCWELKDASLTDLVAGTVLTATGTTSDAADNPTVDAIVTPSFSVSPNVTAPTTDGYTVGFTANTDCTVHVVALFKGSSAPNAAAVIAHTGAVTFATKNVTGADTVTLTGLVFPKHDIYAVVTSLAGTSSVASILAALKAPPTGKQYSTFTSVDPDTKYAEASAPSIAAGDVREIPLEFSDGTDITPSTDGNDAFPWDGRPLYYLGRVYDDSAQGWFAITMPDGSAAPDEYFEVSFGDRIPVREDPELTLLQQLTLNEAMTSVDMADFILDPEATALTFILLSSLPSGMTFNAGVFGGTPNATGTYILDLRAVDAHGGTYDFSYTFLVGRPLAPNLVGLSFDAAAAIMEKQFFILGASSYTITEFYDEGTVLSQDPPADTEVDRFSTISLTLAQAVPIPVAIRVRANQAGFFNGYQKRVGEEFVLLEPEQYSPYWMTLLDTPPAEWTHRLEDQSAEVQRMIIKQPAKRALTPEPFRSLIDV